MAFNRELSQFAAYLDLDAAGKYIGITPAESTTNVGIGVTNPSEKLSVVGNANITGVVTATQFYGNIDYSYVLNATAGVRTEFSVVDNGGDGSLSYDSQTGIISYVGPSSAEARAHFSATSTNLGSFTYDSETGVFAYSGVTTANIRDQFSASSTDIGSLAYDSATGQFSLSGVTTSAIRDQFSGGTGVTITDGEVAIGQAVGTSDGVTFASISATGIVTATGGFDGNLTGNVTGDLTGNADTATALETSRDFSASGDATAPSVSFDGTGNVDLVLTLADTTVAAGSYGSSSEIPTFTVDSKGRLTAAGTTSVGTDLTVAGDSGSETIQLLNDTLTIAGGTNLTSSAASDTVTINLDDNISLTSVTASGIVTASEFVTGASGEAIGINTNTISGPATLVLDPAAVGDDTGKVVIKGDLQVDGTQTIINSTTVTIEDKNIQVADGAANDAAADGAGITVNSGDGDKTFQFNDASDAFKANISLDVASGQVYKINGTEVLSSDTLGSAVVNSSLTSVGTLGQLNVSGVTTSTGGFAGDLTGNVTGNVTGDVTGNADTATALETSRDFSASGDATASAVSFDGTGNVDLVLTLANTGVTTGSYGSSTEIPTFTVDSKGRLTAAGTASVGTALTVTGDSGSEVINLLTETLTIAGGTNLTSSAASDTVTINLDDNISLVSVSASGIVTATGGFAGDLTGDVTGNADTATALETGRDFSVSGDATASAVSFDGTGNVGLALTFATVNSDVGSYGSSTAIPIVTVNEKGLVTAVSTASVGTALTVAGDSGSENIDLLSETLTIAGGTNLTSSAAGNSVTVNLDDNISLVSVSASGIVTATGGFAGDLTGDVTGNADTATALETSRDFSVSGDVATASAVSFDGTGNVDLSVTLSNNFSANTSGIVTATGGFVGDLTGDVTGNADTATALETGRDFSISGDATASAVSFDGTANVGLALTLADTAVTPGSYGSSTEIPTFTVDSKGRLTAAGTASVGTALTVTGDSGSEVINLLTDSLSIAGGTNLTSSAASDTVTINLDDNISLVSVSASGIITATSGFSGDLTGNVTGDVTGNADTATALETGRDFSISGDATASSVSFDGTANVGLALTLADTAVTPGSYGSSTEIPTFTVDSKGRLTAAGTASVGTALTVSGDSGSEVINLLSETLTIAGGTNLTSSAASDTVTIDLDDNISLTSVTASGIITAAQFVTGASGEAIGINTNVISGPATITIDPAAVGDDTGKVVIKGDLQVDGTQTIINSTSLSVDDLNILLADGAVNDAAANGGGFTVQSGEGDKTFQFEATGDNFGSSENMNLASGKVYKINNTEVLSSDTLGSAVVNSSLTSVGTLGQLNVSGVTTSSGGFSGNLTGNVTGNVTGDVTGNADTATALETSRDFSASGDATASAVSFDGTGNVDLVLTLANTGVTTGSYGSASEIPTFTVDSKGRLTAAGTVSVSTGMTIAGDTGSETIQLLTETLTISGDDHVTTSASADTLTISVDATSENTNSTIVARDSSGGFVAGIITATSLDGDVTGDLTGNVYTSSGISTFNDIYIAGTLADVNSGVGSEGQILVSVGTGVSWKNLVDELPQARTTQSFTATGGQTAFSFVYNVGYLDVYVNGVRLSSAEFTATNGTDITLAEGAFSGDNVEFVSYATVGTGSGSVNSLNDLTDVTLTGSSAGNILSYNGSGWVNTSTLSGITSLDATTTATIEAAVGAAPNDFTSLNISGISTFAGAVDANAGANISGGLEIDTINASGIVTASAFYGDGSNLTGINAGTATSLATARTIGLGGDLSGSASFDGSANITITATIADDSHDHVISNVDGLQDALNLKAPLESPALTGTPTAPTAAAGTNTTQVATTAFVSTAVANLVDTAPEALNTLNELAAALGDDADFATTVSTSIGTKLDSSSYTASDVLTKIKTVDGTGSGLDADLLDGQEGSYYRDASNINTGTIGDAYLPATISSDITGNAATATTATNAVNCQVDADDSTDATHYITFTGGATGNQRLNSDTALYYNPSSNILNAGNFNSTSDINLKKDIEVIANPNELLKEINGVRFAWKENDEKTAGVIAQDVEKVLPELVATNEKGTKSVSYNGLIGLLIEAVKEQGQQIEALKAEIAELKK